MPEAPKVAHKSSVAEINKEKLEFIEEVTKNADEIQKRVLAEILHRNANVEYLKRHGLNRHFDRNSFKKIMPVVTYEDILPDINRIALGDTSPILCADPVSEFLTRFNSLSLPLSQISISTFLSVCVWESKSLTVEIETASTSNKLRWYVDAVSISTIYCMHTITIYNQHKLLESFTLKWLV